MTEPFANADDVAARWRPLTDNEALVADTLTFDASSLIRARFPGIDAQVTGGTFDPNLLRIVVAEMVKRALIAPLDGVSQESETVGPYAHSQTFANPTRRLFITDDELLLIRGYTPRAGSFSFGNTTAHYEPASGVYGGNW